MGLMGSYVVPNTIWVPTGPESLGPEVSAFQATPGSAVWPASATALYIPFYLPGPAVIQQMAILNGASVAGTIDLGIYDYAGRRLVSSGPTTQAGTAVLQFLDLTDTIIGPGWLYAAACGSDGTATYSRTAYAALVAEGWGILQQASVGSSTLPSTATFAAVTAAYQPLLALIMGRIT